MKKINLTKVNAISKLIVSITALVLCVSLFLFSINKAVANDTTFNFPDTLTNKDVAAINNSGGTYKMEMTTQTYGDGAVVVYILVYNTATGTSKLYNIYGRKAIKALPSQYQLPANPL